MNWFFDQDRPACVILIGSGRFFGFLDLTSSSFSVSSTCSRRDFCCMRLVARAAGSARVALASRCSALRSPDSSG